MNKVFLIGRLTADPDIRYSGEMSIARYTIAVDRPKKGEADFIRCVAFDKGATFAEKYLSKGTKICVEGRIQTGSYTAKDGQKVYTTEVVVSQHEFVERKAETAGNGTVEPEKAAPDAPDNTWMNIPDNVDDFGLPFN